MRRAARHASGLSRRRCAWSRPVGNCWECRANTPGRLQPLDCSEPDSPAQRFFRPPSRRGPARDGDRGRCGGDHRDCAAARRAAVGDRAGRRAGRRAGHRGSGRADRRFTRGASWAVWPAGVASRGTGRCARRSNGPNACCRTTHAKRSPSGRSSPVPSAAATRRRCSQVAPDIIDELARRSLLSVEIHSGRTYYGMLKTVRSVVGSASDSHRTQASGVLRAAAAQAAAALQTPEEPAAHRRIVELMDELRLAHSRARSIDVETAVQMSMALHWFGVSRLHTERVRLGRQARAAGAGPARTCAQRLIRRSRTCTSSPSSSTRPSS